MKTKTASPAKKKAATKAKKKTLSPSKKKAATTGKKKPLAATKKKAVSAAKKKPAPATKKTPLKKKSASLAQQKLKLNKQVMDFVTDAFKGRRVAYFVHDSVRSKDGAYIACVAIEDEAGFYKFDWGWHCSDTKAKAEAALMNKKLGLTEEEVNEIIISTMGTAKCR
jgi:hypothetical protein